MSDDDSEYPGNLTPYVVFTCAVAAMGGLIFGYDIGISGGVTSMDTFLEKFFPSILLKLKADSSKDTSYCKFESHLVSMFTSSLYLAALVSSLGASTVTRKLSRKLSMLLGGAFFLLGAFLNCSARAIWMLILGRILQGFGVGFSNQSVPVYLSEIAPYKYRGALNIGFQLCITLGILIANLLNYGFSRINTDLGWRLSLGGAAVPAAIVVISSLALPETPSSMIEQGHLQKARAQLEKLRGVSNVDEEFNDLVSASEASKIVEHPWRNLLDKKYRFYVVMAVAIPMFQSLSGINVIIFYVPLLFKTFGYGSQTSLISAVITGGVNVLATGLSIYGVDKWGRRFLFIQGGIQMLICQIVVGICVAVKLGGDKEPPAWYAILVVGFICIFVAGFAWSWGPLGWLVPSEIFPLEIRSAAQSLNVSVNMGCTFMIGQLFLTMLCHLKFWIFFVFALFVLLMTIFIYLVLPETKNIPIEEMFIQIAVVRVL